MLKSKSKITQCRKFKLLKVHKLDGTQITLPKFDVIFVAPLTSDYDVDYKDIKYVVPYSNRLNTFFFSEYNDKLSKDVDFHTGIGEDRYGLFMTKIQKNTKLPQLKHRYAVVYIAETISGANKCFLSFMEMIAKKYSKQYKKFDIVVPGWVTSKIDKYKKKIIKMLGKYYDTIVSIDKSGHEYLVDRGDSMVLNIRGDIFPLQNQDMLRLIKYSVRDILLTGDQSITDALSCCSGQKNIFYQIAPWKENFGKHLAKDLPNKYLEKKATSCGTIQAIKYHSNYSNFKKKWDFRKLARRKMDAIFLSAVKRVARKTIQEFEEIILNSKTLQSFDNKFIEWIEDQ